MWFWNGRARVKRDVGGAELHSKKTRSESGEAESHSKNAREAPPGRRVLHFDEPHGRSSSATPFGRVRGVGCLELAVVEAREEEVS